MKEVEARPPTPDEPDGPDETLLRYHLRCRRDDLRAGLPGRTGRIVGGSLLTATVAVAGVALGGSWPAVVGVTLVFAVPVMVAWAVLLRDRRRLRRLERRLRGVGGDAGSAPEEPGR